MKVNGREVHLENTCSLFEFLEKEGYQMDKIAVEQNFNIVPKSQYQKVLLNESDTLEVVSFVGGG